MNVLRGFIPTIKLSGRGIEIKIPIFGGPDKPERPPIDHEQILEQQRRAHEESMERLESMRRDAAYAYEKAENAAREECRVIRRENNETIELLRHKIENDDENLKILVQELNDGLSEKLKNLREAGQEERKNVQEEFEEKMTNLKKEHETRKEALQEELKNVKKEGKKKIRKMEKESKKLKEKRENQLAKEQKDMDEMAENYENERKKIIEHQFNMRKEMGEEKRKNCELEQIQNLQQLNDLTSGFNALISNDATKRVLEETNIITDIVQKTRESLMKLNIYCASDSPKEHQGNVRLELDEINKMKSMFEFHAFKVQQHIMNESSANPEAVKVCKNYLHQLKEPMGSKQLFAICALLLSDLANGNIKKIQSYGNDAGSLAQKLETIQVERDVALVDICMRNVQSAMNSKELKN
ncbi:hypothetical protein CRE_01422 [Caenorhabditis remanei]|uniref:Protein containing ALS2cr12 (ALS2CR12) signature n=1 Tax=Caenorhabditis remanei TaxID=31234 RepID=E3NKJ0_CAERE|nr:hypothetical protein CRE_01422 [Caenorhabditis remanei]